MVFASRAFVSATQEMGPAAGLGGGIGPVLDRTAVPTHPGEALRDGTAADVPVLIGCNRDEGAGGLPAELDEAGLRERLATYGQEHVGDILETYKGLFPEASPVDILSWAITDAGMRAGSIRLAEAKLKGTTSPVFMYFFTYEMAGRGGHGYEIAFVFDNVREPIAHPSAGRTRLAEQMSEAWLAFARDGEPGHHGLPKWPAYTVPDRATMVFGHDGGTVATDPSAEARELWRRVPAPARPMMIARPPA